MSSDTMQLKHAASRHLPDGCAPDVRPGYKRTDVGIIPEDWETDTLRSLLSQPATYGIVKAGQFVNSGVPMVRGGDIKHGIVSLDLPNVTHAKSEEFSRTKLHAGDVLVALVGYPGEAAVCPGALEGANISRAVGLLRPRAGNRADYIVSYLNSPMGRREFLKPGAGSAQLVVNLSDLNSLRVPLPQRVEQRAIAEALSHVDALLGALDALIAKARAIKRAAMQQLLTGKTRLPGFSGEWDTKAVSQLGYVVTGGTPSTEVDGYWGGDIPWVTPTDISTSRDIAVTERMITPRGLASIRALPPNAVLVTCIASIGKNAVLRSRGGCNQQINAIVPSDKHSAEFLYYLFEYNKSFLVAHAGMTATNIISKRVFSRLSFRIPLRDEQTTIASILSDMDSEIAALGARRDKTRAIKQGMMQQLLSGRVRLVKPVPAKATA